MKNRTIVFFDLDGTITQKDTMIEFILFFAGFFGLAKFIFFNNFLIIKLCLGFAKRVQVKEAILTYFFKGKSITYMNSIAEDFSNKKFPSLVRPSALKVIDWHRKEKHEIVIVTASLDLWVKHWANQMKIKLICTRLDVTNGLVTGKIKGRNCNYYEKVQRIKSTYDLSRYNEIYCYGNSKGDLEMLNIATKCFYKHF